MKRITSSTRSLCLLTALLLLASVASGCDSFLDKEPKGQIAAESFLESERDANLATNATYSTLRNFNVHVFAWLGLTDIVSDDATKGSTPTDGTDTLLGLDDLIFDPTLPAFSGAWSGYYTGIHNANLAINQIPQIEMDEGERARLVAENKFLRAYFYFFLVRAYGGVPLITETLELGDFERGRDPAEDVYGLIIQDLQDAAEVLPAIPPAAGRVTRGAALGLLSKVYLFREDYPNAQQTAEQVITSGTYALEPSYSFVFTQDGEFSSGSIFEVNAVALDAGGGATEYSLFQGVRGTPNLGYGFNQPTTSLETSYEPGDPRQDAAILYPWEPVQGTDQVVFYNPNIPNQRYNEKAQAPLDNVGGNRNSGVNIRRLRYADVLLIAAEAAYQNGDAATARTYLNQVRARARGEATATLGLMPQRLTDAIATDNLGLSTDSRVFVRYASADGGAAAAGVQSAEVGRLDRDAVDIPILVGSMDLITSANGTAITTPESYQNAVAAISPGDEVPLEILRVTQQTQDTVVMTSTETLQVSVTAQALLPDVTASGEALLDAIWRERRAELVMEQQRWFDIVRQGRVRDGRTAELMEAVGADFEPYQRVFPIPQNEIDLSGGLLEQNPEY